MDYGALPEVVKIKKRSIFCFNSKKDFNCTELLWLKVSALNIWRFVDNNVKLKLVFSVQPLPC